MTGAGVAISGWALNKLCRVAESAEVPAFLGTKPARAITFILIVVWAFVGAKEKNASPEQKAAGWGDVWTWTGLDADTKLCVSYLVGGRHAGWAAG